METLKNTNILIVDDHRIVAHGLQALLSEENDVGCIDAVSSAEEALSAAHYKNYGIFIIDVELPDMSGLQLLGLLRQISPASACIFHTMHEELWTIKAMMSAGADAIVLKSGDLADLSTAVAEVAAGNSYYSPRIHEYCRSMEQQMMPSERELEILKAIARGENTDEISRGMGISSNTVEYYRKRLFRKLGASNMADMIVRAIRRGLLFV